MEMCRYPLSKFYIHKAYQIKWLKHLKSSKLTAPFSSWESFPCPRQALKRAARMLCGHGAGCLRGQPGR